MKGRKQSCPPNDNSDSRVWPSPGEGRRWDGQGCMPGAMEGLSPAQKTPSTHEGKLRGACVLLISSGGRDVFSTPFYRWENRVTEHEDAHFTDKCGTGLCPLDLTWYHPSPCLPVIKSPPVPVICFCKSCRSLQIVLDLSLLYVMRQSWQHVLKAQQQQEAYVLRVKLVGFFFSCQGK